MTGLACDMVSSSGKAVISGPLVAGEIGKVEMLGNNREINRVMFMGNVKRQTQVENFLK